MKRLTLVRHANSSRSDSELRDFDRPLNQRGKNDAPVVGQRLAELPHRPELIISSPAKRAVTTAEVMADELGYPKHEIIQNEAIYEGVVAELLPLIQQIDEKVEHTMLVGHNPGLTDLSIYLSHVRLDNIPTCGVFCLDFDVVSWQEISKGSGQFVFFDSPQNPNPISAQPPGAE